MVWSLESVDPVSIIIYGTIFFTMLVAGIVAILLLYQRRLLKEENRRKSLEIENQKKILNAVLTTQEKERSRIANDLHDDIGSMIFNLKRKLGELEYGNGNMVELVGVNEKLVEEISARIRAISHNMMPPALKDGKLAEAIQKLGDLISKSTGASVVVKDDGHSLRIPVEHQLPLFRVVSEWINNAIKHGGAGNFIVRLSGMNGSCRLILEDDGQSFDFKQALAESQGLGLKGIAGRLDQIRADFHYVSDHVSNRFEIVYHLTAVT